mmetsp:Transcript_32963/g.55546  ORF Transcript_32963/g.55546 Transcript_32963/m.55546 type:complete len:82 (+) Transcript_32963:100-345(+)
MHPPLFREHPNCKQIVQDLIKCHEDHSIGKFFGACNDVKAALDACFKEEKEERRIQNFNKAKRNNQAWEDFMATENAKKSK